MVRGTEVKFYGEFPTGNLSQQTSSYLSHPELIPSHVNKNEERKKDEQAILCQFSCVHSSLYAM